VQTDANWNVTALVDASGNVVERYVYDPYGAVTVLTPSWAARGTSLYGWMYFFQGKRRDGTVGLDDSRWRVYSPTLMRPMQADLLGLVPGNNDYEWEGDSTTDRTDPRGTDWERTPIYTPKTTPEQIVRFQLDGYNTQIVLLDGFSKEEVQEITDALNLATKRINGALRGFEDWDSYSQFHYVHIKGAKRDFASPVYERIAACKSLHENRVKQVSDWLYKSDTIIYFTKTSYIHGDRNPMCTVSWPWDRYYADHIVLRGNFWDIGPIFQGSWTSHELARYFLFLEDDKNRTDGHGVQEWDEMLDFFEAHQQR